MISLLHWDGTAKDCHEESLDRLSVTVAEVAADDVWWIDLTDPTPEEEEHIFGKFFRVHPLSREDITRPRTDPDHGAHLPKAEEFPDYLLVIVNPLPQGLAEALKLGPQLPLI